ncbi:hypothetical protein DM82_3531 [Burkholderia oklahomensis]|uniref:Uncharacterized protein n=1 Tax=Burkholderia oklahomensis TaxID=342113 RepID=A0AAI8B5E0_9BURK|nr:hypothetical protein DM82_3531 [Burkholderia oklahomensis]AJX32831.1 hypothetical protein BG90_1287 [Burkholderia oklahomensis C6786]SUW59295.1 Uncharacterised protein [Burkholderia oklahomensis]
MSDGERAIRERVDTWLAASRAGLAVRAQRTRPAPGPAPT